jgi:DNA-binding MarR family transcriptional regulator
MPPSLTKEAGPSSALLRFMQAYLRFSIDDMTAALKEHELSMPQLAALQFVRAEGPQSVSAIADHLNLSRTATSHLVDRLVRKELVRREEDPRDRRQKTVTLGGAGAQLLAGIHRRSAATLDALLLGVPEDRRAALERAMHDVVTDLEVTDLETTGRKGTS